MVIFLNSRSEKLVPEDELSRQREYALQVKKLLELRYPGRTPLAHVHTFGCQQNVSDGEKIKGMLQGMGYDFCTAPADADLVIYNTCAIRENAEDKVFGSIGQLSHCKNARKDMILGYAAVWCSRNMLRKKSEKAIHISIWYLGHMCFTDCRNSYTVL